MSTDPTARETRPADELAEWTIDELIGEWVVHAGARRRIRAELERLRDRDEKAAAVLQVFRRHDNYRDRLYACGHPLLADAITALDRAHENGGSDR